eukprot:3468413-Amphidinium_carterae.1
MKRISVVHMCITCISILCYLNHQAARTDDARKNYERPNTQGKKSTGETMSGTTIISKCGSGRRVQPKLECQVHRRSGNLTQFR